MKKVKIGVLGGYRGSSMINFCKRADNAEVVAICDKNPDVIEFQKENTKGLDISFYYDYDEFLKHDMDAVVLANYANQHAPFAIKAMRAGKHVYSEVLPVQNMKEAVELIEAVEETGMIYAYGENYCFMPAPQEMRKLYREGKIGEFEYGECEYIHNCESVWHSITYGDPDHWRNNMYSNFYCTHSLGPIIHMTGLRPVTVTGFESKMVERKRKVGAKSGLFGIEMVTLENGGIIKSIHGDLFRNSIWYSVYGSEGHMESAREEADSGHVFTLYLGTDADENAKAEKLSPTHSLHRFTEGYGHGGSDFYSMYFFVEKVKGDENADTIDVYEALDMFLPGLFAYRSVLDGGKPQMIPNLRNKEEREKWRGDTACTDPEAAGDMLLPTFSLGTPEIPDEVYENMKALWKKECESKDASYRQAAFSQGSEKAKKN